MKIQDLWKAENGCMVKFCNISIHKCKGTIYLPHDNKFAKISFTGLLDNSEKSKTKLSFITEFYALPNQTGNKFTCATSIEITEDSMILDYIIYKKTTERNPPKLQPHTNQVHLEKVKLNTDSLLKEVD